MIVCSSYQVANLFSKSDKQSGLATIMEYTSKHDFISLLSTEACCFFGCRQLMQRGEISHLGKSINNC